MHIQLCAGLLAEDYAESCTSDYAIRIKETLLSKSKRRDLLYGVVFLPRCWPTWPNSISEWLQVKTVQVVFALDF